MKTYEIKFHTFRSAAGNESVEGYTSRFGFLWWFWIPRIHTQRPDCQNPRIIRLIWLCFAVGVSIWGPESSHWWPSKRNDRVTKQSCTHEPEDTVGPVAARHCRHCGAEIQPAACAECHGMEFVTDDQGREIDCPDCDGTGRDGWREA